MRKRWEFHGASSYAARSAQARSGFRGADRDSAWGWALSAVPAQLFFVQRWLQTWAGAREGAGDRASWQGMQAGQRQGAVPSYRRLRTAGPSRLRTPSSSSLGSEPSRVTHRIQHQSWPTGPNNLPLHRLPGSIFSSCPFRPTPSQGALSRLVLSATPAWDVNP